MSAAKSKATAKDQQAQDHLIKCLAKLCAHHGFARSEESLKSGLPYEGQVIGPELFCEAARNAGLHAKTVKKAKLDGLSPSVLPCVVFLDKASPVLVLEKNGNALKFYDPAHDEVMEHKISSVQDRYTGYAILAYPKASLDHSAQSHASIKSSGHWFWGLVRENKRTYQMVIVASLFINLFALVSPLFVMNVYDRVIPNEAIDTGWALGIGALVAFIFDFIFRNLRGYLIDFSGRRIDVSAAKKIYGHVLNMKLSDRPPSSGAFANMLRDFDAVREFFTSATITALVDLPFSLLFLFFVYQLGGGIAFILLALVVIVMVIGMVIQVRLKSLVGMATKTAESKHGVLVETIHGLEVIKASGADGRFRSRYGRSVEENAIFAQKSRFLSSLGVNIATFFQQIASVLIILMGMYLVKEGDLSTGGLIACVILGGRAIAPIGQVANLMTRYHQAGGALKTLNLIMSQEVERPEGKSFLHRPSLDGAIKFDGVSFSYPATNIQVLDKVSFTIEPGEKIGIIGKIGSGKSTIAKLMAGLYTAESGQILFDNTDSRQIDPADLRKNMAYIPQNVVLFRGSVRENITAGYPDASEEDILKAAELAGVHEFIARHPMGYDAPVGENGDGLSGGQKQAVALARALIKTPNMIICDEPTNAMDVQAENVFCNSMNDVVKGKTFILITHKNSMLHMLDRLILVHGGKILMDGPRDEVLKALDAGQISVQKA